MKRAPVALRALSSRTGLRRTLVAYALYDFVEFAIWVAIILYAFDEGGASLAALAAIVQLLPAVVVAPLLAGVGDRMPRGTALVVAHAAVAATTALTTVALAASAPVAVVLGAATMATAAIALVRPIHFAALPQLARAPEDLVSANSLSSVADSIGLFAGPVLAGFGVSLVGPWLVFAGATAAAGLATVLCLRLGLAAPAGVEDSGPTGWRAAMLGLDALVGDWGSLALLLVLAINFVIAGALDVLGVSFASSVLGLGQSGAGLLIGAIGVGGLVGAVAASSVSRRRLLTPVVVVGGVLEGLAFASVSPFDLLWPAMGAIALSGVGGAVLMVSGRTLLQRATDDRVLARVFAVQEGVSLLGVALGAAIAPALIQGFSASGAFLPLGLAAALLTLAGAVLIRRLDERTIFLPEELSLLQGVSFLSVLPAYELERLARNTSWIDVAAGSAAVRQGEAGDHFLVIGSGEFSVEVDGLLRPGVLSRGDGFGEIALLHSVPRTATVRSITPGRLLAIRSEDFLAAVTGSEDGRKLAAEVAAAHRARDRADGA